jgi:hypothetical protein
MRNRFLICAAVALITSVAVWADTGVWGNNATFGNVTLEEFNATTGAVIQQFIAPNPTAAASNGRGIAVASDGTIYYTVTDTEDVYVTNATTHTDMGVAFTCTVCGSGGISTITFDGSNLFLTPYQVAGKAYEYTTTGTLVNTITGNFGSGRDGFEIITRDGKQEIVGNRGDAEDPYDLYDINGTLIQSDFILTEFAGTGITYDGTDFYVSNLDSNELDVYDNNGAFIRKVTLGLPLPTSGFGRLLEDLSALGNTIDNPPPDEGAIPEPSSVVLLGTGLMAAGIALRRRCQKS